MRSTWGTERGGLVNEMNGVSEIFSVVAHPRRDKKQRGRGVTTLGVLRHQGESKSADA